jgi:hypothetical protein
VFVLLLMMMMQILNEIQASLGSWVSKGKTVSPAYVGLLQNDSALMSYLDAGTDMEVIFDVSKPSASFHSLSESQGLA